MLRCILLSSYYNYYILFYALGKTDEVSLSDEGIESHDLIGDKDILPPSSKKRCVTTPQSNETPEQVMARELEIKNLAITIFLSFNLRTLNM